MSNKPGWYRELEVFSQIKNALILEGNIYDIFAYPEGSFQGAWLELPACLHVFFTGLGYTHIIQYNHVDGFFSADPRTSQREDQMKAFARLAGSQTKGEFVPAGFNSQSGGAPSLIRSVMKQSRESAVVILNLASRYTASPDRLSFEDQMSYSILLQAILEAREVFDEYRVGRQNMLVFIADKRNDLPPWLYLGLDQVRGIMLEKPTPEERLAMIGGYSPEAFFDRRIYQEDIREFADEQQDLKRIIDQFVARTDGFSFYELEQLRKLCLRQRIHIRDLCSIVDLYVYGVQENPWQDPGLISRLQSGKEILSRRVKGQDDALSQSLDILKRAVSGLSGAKRSAPKGILFFAGPTGTGKTETAKSMAELVFGDETACIRFDMSEYAQEHSDQRLFGAPPGYVGYVAGGQLTNAVRKKPFSILLFDEIEKAAPRIMDKFLQILDDGRMTDGQGNTVYFTDCIIIFTSNLGVSASDPDDQHQINATGSMPREEVRKRITEAIRHHFRVVLGRPELLNRIGENIVVFDYITKEVAWQILDAKLTDFQESVLERAGIRCDFSAVKEILFSKVLDNLENGGRGINNILEKYLINPLTRHIFDDRIQPGEQRIVTALLTEQIPTDLLWEPAIHVKGAFLNA